VGRPREGAPGGAPVLWEFEWRPADHDDNWAPIERACGLQPDAAFRKDLVECVNQFLFARTLELGRGTTADLIRRVTRLSRVLAKARHEIDARQERDPVREGLVVEMRATIQARAMQLLGVASWNQHRSPIDCLAHAATQYLAELKALRPEREPSAWDYWVSNLVDVLRPYNARLIKVTSPVTARLVLELHRVLESEVLPANLSQEFLVHALSKHDTRDEVVDGALKRAQARLRRAGVQILPKDLH
jgi:hypothetical protein